MRFAAFLSIFLSNALIPASVTAFVAPQPASHAYALKSSPLAMVQPSTAMVHDDAAMTAMSFLSSPSLMEAQTAAWVVPTATILGPFLNFMSFAMLVRVVLSWYPEMKTSKMPWLLVALPTEPLLQAAKGFVPPAFGVDITPVFWLAIFTFISEILLGQQGLLTLKIKYDL